MSGRQRDIYRYLDEQPRIIRPFNFLTSNPGRGVTVVDTAGGRLGVVNLSGDLYLYPARSPFEVVDEALEELHGVRNVVVDLHAEATSEKVAMGWHLDGRVSAVIGTHTHVRTADARVLPGGTAYITDAGMCGPRDSVMGVKKELVLERLLTQLPVRFEVADGDVWLEGVVVEIGSDGRALRIEPFEVGGRQPRVGRPTGTRRAGRSVAPGPLRASVRASPLVGHAEAPPAVPGLLQLVDHGHRVVLHRDAALALGVHQQLVAAQPERPGAFARLQHRAPG